ncbi:hypothetical protein KSP40_PGU013761 [Platanthera guangdongensis]|uniref:CRM domain-containing protein n=1 Tax=Platanthera guangdongensis TaxID=2320717 RepID=A0ABR2MYG8_9ASPA
MALGSTALLPPLCSFPTAAPLRSSFKNFISFSRSSFLPPPSSQHHAHRVFLLARLSSPFSNSFSSEDKVEDDLRAEEEEERRKPLAPPPLQATEPVIIAPLPSFPTPQLTIKEKKELASYAHSLGKKLKSQQIGKSGVTSSVAAAMVESLQSNELLKIQIQPGSGPISILGFTIKPTHPIREIATMAYKDYPPISSFFSPLSLFLLPPSFLFARAIGEAAGLKEDRRLGGVAAALGG